MKKLKIYLETTIFNYYFDENRDAHKSTIKLFEEIIEGKYEAYTSNYVIDELLQADEPKKSKMLDLIEKYNIIVLKYNEESEALADKYIEMNIIPKNYKYDGIHIAIASINKLDYIFSLNFKHINKLKTKLMTENINIQEGYKGIIICSPMEVVEDEE